MLQTPRAVLVAIALLLAAAVPASAATRTRPTAVRLSASTPRAVTRGHAARVTIKITNATRSSLKRLVVSVAPAKGVKASWRSRTARTLRARRHTTLALTLTPGTTAASSTKSTISVRRAGRLLTRTTAQLKIATTAPAPGPTPTPPVPVPQPANPLAGRYFYRTELIGAGMYYITYYFANGQLAYRGAPSGGLPDCPAATAQGDGDGCIPYTYDPASGTVSVDGKRGALTAPHVLRLDDGPYAEAETPAAGTTFDLYAHSLNGAGDCGVSCTYVASEILFKPSGTFARSTAVSSSTPEGDFTSLPPDQHGAYQVQPGGKILFTYADGHTLTETLGIMNKDDDHPDPQEGILLDGSIYWGPSSGV
jgi:cytochrome c5